MTITFSGAFRSKRNLASIDLLLMLLMLPNFGPHSHCDLNLLSHMRTRSELSLTACQSKTDEVDENLDTYIPGTWDKKYSFGEPV